MVKRLLKKGDTVMLTSKAFDYKSLGYRHTSNRDKTSDAIRRRDTGEGHYPLFMYPYRPDVDEETVTKLKMITDAYNNVMKEAAQLFASIANGEEGVGINIKTKTLPETAWWLWDTFKNKRDEILNGGIGDEEYKFNFKKHGRSHNDIFNHITVGSGVTYFEMLNMADTMHEYVIDLHLGDKYGIGMMPSRDTNKDGRKNIQPEPNQFGICYRCSPKAIGVIMDVYERASPANMFYQFMHGAEPDIEARYYKVALNNGKDGGMACWLNEDYIKAATKSAVTRHKRMLEDWGVED